MLAVIKDLTARTYVFAALETLEYLRRSGRVSGLLTRIGSWFQILPVMKLHLDDIGMDPVRTRKNGLRRVIQLVEALGPLEELGVVHANAPQHVAEIRQAASWSFRRAARPWK